MMSNKRGDEAPRAVSGTMKLNGLKVNENAVITDVGGEGALRQHFLDMGRIPDPRTALTHWDVELPLTEACALLLMVGIQGQSD